MDDKLVITKDSFKFARRFLRLFIFSFIGLIILAVIFTSISYIDNTIDGAGFIVPKEEYEIRAEISGRIKEVFVEDGEEVKKGDLLVSFVDTEDKIALEKKKEDLKIHEAKLTQLYH